MASVKGRKSLLSDDVIEKVCEARQVGATWRIAAGYAGVSHSSLMAWRSEAEKIQTEIEEGARKSVTKEESLLLDFLTKTTEADAADDINLLAVIDKEAAMNWQAAWTRLRLKHKDGSFDLAQKIDANVSAAVVGADLTQQIQNLTEEQIAKTAGQLANLATLAIESLRGGGGNSTGNDSAGEDGGEADA